MSRFLVPVNSQKALEGRTIKEVKHGSDAAANTTPYSVYTLVLDNGEEIVITQILGEICFSKVKGTI
jgi:hypothetical protein